MSLSLLALFKFESCESLIIELQLKAELVLDPFYVVHVLVFFHSNDHLMPLYTFLDVFLVISQRYPKLVSKLLDLIIGMDRLA